jgi:8-oxo-dGTP pyrophosphatase MutT (NUDIX family)
MSGKTREARPSLVDRLFQAAYWLAFRGALVLWFLTRPAQEGFLVQIRHDGRSLLIRNSYHSLWSAPGGSAKPGESPEAAASRETMEEVGIQLPPAELALALDVEHRFRFRRDRVRIFVWATSRAPEIAIDNREVVEARWFTPEEALRLPLIPHLRDLFASEAARDEQSRT